MDPQIRGNGNLGQSFENPKSGIYYFPFIDIFRGRSVLWRALLAIRGMFSTKTHIVILVRLWNSSELGIYSRMVDIIFKSSQITKNSI